MLEFNKTYIIAEIGVNHQGNINIAKKLISSAKSIGADAVKFQSFKTDLLSSRKAPKVNYQKKSNPKETHYEMLKSLELSYNQQKLLFEYCKKKEIEFISTPYDIESAKFLYKLGCRIFKVASADIVDGRLHKYLNKLNSKIIISTGMSTTNEINQALNLYNSKKNLILLHCVSNYPCSLNSLNLNNINMLNKKFNLPVGFSDHYVNNLAAIISVSMGAKVIEKHFTLDRRLKGPDHAASFNPKQFKNYIESIREAEIALGSKNRVIHNEEKQMRLVSRKSAVLNKNIKKNMRLKEKYIDFIRPGTGLNYFKIKKIFGKIAKKDLNKKYIIKLDDFK